MIYILKTGRIKRVELPELTRGVPKVLAVDINNNVYVARGHSDEGFILTMLDGDYNVRAKHALDILEEILSLWIKITIFKNNDISSSFKKVTPTCVFVTRRAN